LPIGINGRWSGAVAAVLDIVVTLPTFGLRNSVTCLERPVRKFLQPLSVFKSRPLSPGP